MNVSDLQVVLGLKGNRSIPPDAVPDVNTNSLVLTEIHGTHQNLPGK